MDRPSRGCRAAEHDRRIRASQRVLARPPRGRRAVSGARSARRRLGRAEDGLLPATRRSGIRRAGTFRRWFGLGSVERAWALDEARRAAQGPHATGQALVEIALGDGDLDAAWAAADEFGSGEAWWRLAEASQHTLPIRAIELHLTSLRPKLERADARTYTEVAKQLVTMRAFYEAGDALDDFEALLRDLRETYRRRPTFIATLDKARLPGRA